MAKPRITLTMSYDSPGNLYSFPVPKISVKFQRDHPQRGRQIEVEYIQIGDFPPISRYSSKTVGLQGSDIVTIEG